MICLTVLVYCSLNLIEYVSADSMLFCFFPNCAVEIDRSFVSVIFFLSSYVLNREVVFQ